MPFRLIDSIFHLGKAFKSGDLLSSPRASSIWQISVHFIANGHNMVEMASGQYRLAYKRLICGTRPSCKYSDISFNDAILVVRSYIIFWFALSTASLKPFSTNLPLSAQYFFMVTPWDDAIFTNNCFAKIVSCEEESWKCVCPMLDAWSWNTIAHVIRSRVWPHDIFSIEPDWTETIWSMEQ